jgi:hypothetical protein
MWNLKLSRSSSINTAVDRSISLEQTAARTNATFYSTTLSI